jgi:hypothetical protein
MRRGKGSSNRRHGSRHPGGLPPAAVTFAAARVKVNPALSALYAWPGRTAEYHRAQLRAVPGFRERRAGDEDKPADWLAAEVRPAEPNRDLSRRAASFRAAEAASGR